MRQEINAYTTTSGHLLLPTRLPLPHGTDCTERFSTTLSMACALVNAICPDGYADLPQCKPLDDGCIPVMGVVCITIGKSINITWNLETFLTQHPPPYHCCIRTPACKFFSFRFVANRSLPIIDTRRRSATHTSVRSKRGSSLFITSFGRLQSRLFSTETWHQSLSHVCMYVYMQYTLMLNYFCEDTPQGVGEEGGWL